VERVGEEVTMGAFLAIPRAKKFRYLGSIIEEKRDIDEDINQRIRVRRMEKMEERLQTIV